MRILVIHNKDTHPLLLYHFNFLILSIFKYAGSLYTHWFPPGLTNHFHLDLYLNKILREFNWRITADGSLWTTSKFTFIPCISCNPNRLPSLLLRFTNNVRRIIIHPFVPFPNLAIRYFLIYNGKILETNNWKSGGIGGTILKLPIFPKI